MRTCAVKGREFKTMQPGTVDYDAVAVKTGCTETKVPVG